MSHLETIINSTPGLFDKFDVKRSVNSLSATLKFHNHMKDFMEDFGSFWARPS